MGVILAVTGLSMMTLLSLTAAGYAADDGAKQGDAAAPPVKRVALVIGNSRYDNAPRLANTINDARAVGKTLERLEFDVILAIDTSQRQLRDAARAFGEQAANAHIAVAFYAGHAIQVDGANYIIPIDSQLARKQDLNYEVFPLDAIIDEAAQAKQVSVVILDACRDNPFTRKLRIAFGKSRSAASVKDGLAVVEKTPAGTMVAYATSADDVAADGAGQHSPYTEALLHHLPTPGLELGLLFRKVRDDVILKTQGAQTPFVYGSLPSREIYLTPRKAREAPDISADVKLWNTIKNSAMKGDFEHFIRAHPKSQLRGIAESRIAEIDRKAALNREQDVWRRAEKNNQIPDYENYLKTYPQGLYASLAKARLTHLRERQADTERERQTRAEQDKAVELKDWQAIKDSADRVDFEGFIRAHPKSQLRGIAETRIAEIDRRAKLKQEAEDWKHADDANQVKDFEDFLKAHPDGLYTPVARIRLKQLKAESASKAAEEAKAKATRPKTVTETKSRSVKSRKNTRSPATKQPVAPSKPAGAPPPF